MIFSQRCCHGKLIFGINPRVVFSGLLCLVFSAIAHGQTTPVDSSSLDGKVMVGYQGWFNCPNDGAGLGWKHWTKNRKKQFSPGNVTVDLWPDVSELDEDERFATGFRFPNGRAAEVFSSFNRKTVMRHFGWMKEYGIDGAFLQRFANGLKSEAEKRHKDEVLEHVRSGAETQGRSFAIMYDLSGLRAGETVRVCEDWKQLCDQDRLTESVQYQHHNGKPLVAVWGIGFGGEEKPREYTLDECRELIEFLKSQGCSVMLGVPTGWLQLHRDSIDDPRLHQVLQLSDIISPWTVGRYRNAKEAERHQTRHWKPDIQWCHERRLDYMPVVFPGFSWHNLNGAPLGSIPRDEGRFFWSQIVLAKKAGAKMLYIAMFDEVDEGTAIFKCTNEPPTGNGGQFLTYEGLPNDHYLHLAGDAAKLLHNSDEAVQDLP